jgi:predicted nucleic acid-binding protein
MNLENPKENSVVITDASCFILLDKINALHILNDVFTIVITTPEIAKEYGKSLPAWVIIQSALDRELQHKFGDIVDNGEASAIALAAEITCDYLILDDTAARKLAEKLKMRVKGTLGIFVLAKQKGIIPLFRPYLEMVEATNFRLSQQVTRQLLYEADEE